MPPLDLPGSAIVEAMDDPVLAVDGGTVVAANDAARDVLGSGDTLDDWPALQNQVRRRENGAVAVDGDDGTAYYDCRVSAVEADGRTLDLVVLRDVTAHHREQQSLRRANERLDRFASVVAHDLRNPLDVAIGRTTAVDELVDDPRVEAHLEEITASHERMLRIVDDGLALARGGDVEDASAVDLDGAAERAWSHVETDGATLDLRTDATVVADCERLERIFENLFRNAVKHGPADGATTLTVTVDELPDGNGFAVADDGIGIDATRRTEVLEAGVSGGNGTGLGLAIVSTLAEGHGWSVSVTESDAGGARVEFAGVETTTAR